MFIIKYKKIFFTITATLVLASLISIFTFGLNYSIDFNGGAIIELEYTGDRPALSTLDERAKTEGLGNVLIQETGSKGLIVRTEKLKDAEHIKLLRVLSLDNTVQLQEKRFNTVGPIVGEELKKKAWVALAVVVVTIILFIAFAFRKVSEPVSSWKYGLIAIVALIHDIIIPTGVFAFLGSMFIEFQIDILFVMALLAILGYSVNDTIVVFDRIRENLKKNKEEHTHKEFSETVGKSLRETYARSINTSFTTLLVLLVLYFIGGVATQQFALTLAIGVVAGTYSSVFLASPLLVVAERLFVRRK